MLDYLRSKAIKLAKADSEDEVEEITDEIMNKYMPYVALLETDGGPDHNLKFLHNILSLLALFKLGKMDKLVAVRGCPGLSYLNTVERCMAILNLGLANLALMIDPTAPEWLFNVLEGCGSMKEVQSAVALYDAELVSWTCGIPLCFLLMCRHVTHADDTTSQKKAIIVKERQATSDAKKRSREELQQATQTKNDDESYPLGFKQDFFFDPNGWFEGEVKDVSDEQGDEGDKYTVFFSVDNTTEQFSQSVMEEQEELGKIPLGDVDQNFVKLFRVQGVGKKPFAGFVESISKAQIRKCVFSDRGVVQYLSLSQMRLTCLHHYLEPIDSDSSDSESEDNQDGVEDQMSEGNNSNDELESEAAPGLGDNELDEESR